MAKNKTVPENSKMSKRNDKFFNKSKKFNLKSMSNKNNKFTNQTSDNFKTSTGGTTTDEFFVQPIKSKDKTDSVQENPSKSVEKPEKSEKKPFDKKLWRLQKYSKKYKLQEWEDKRKKAVLRGYYRTLNEDSGFDVKKIYEESEDQPDKAIAEENPNKKKKPFKKAQEEFERIKAEKTTKKEEFLKRKMEKEEALKEYKKKKNEKFKKLNRKTKKGQPIMKERMEMLLEQIQNSLNE